MSDKFYLGYSGYYDTSEKENKIEKIPLQISKGIIFGIIFQFVADIIISIFFTEENILESDIKISNIPKYYAAAGSGAIASYAQLFADRHAIAPISITSYAYINNFLDSKLNEENFDIDITDLVFDIIAVEILLFLFDSKAHNDYLNHYNDGHHILAPKLDGGRSTSQIIFFTVINTSFFAFKRQYFEKYKSII